MNSSSLDLTPTRLEEERAYKEIVDYHMGAKMLESFRSCYKDPLLCITSNWIDVCFVIGLIFMWYYILLMKKEICRKRAIKQKPISNYTKEIQCVTLLLGILERFYDDYGFNYRNNKDKKEFYEYYGYSNNKMDICTEKLHNLLDVVIYNKELRKNLKILLSYFSYPNELDNVVCAVNIDKEFYELRKQEIQDELAKEIITDLENNNVN